MRGVLHRVLGASLPGQLAAEQVRQQLPHRSALEVMQSGSGPAAHGAYHPGFLGGGPAGLLRNGTGLSSSFLTDWR